MLNVARSSSSAGANLTRSVTSSIRLAWGCGHQEGLSNFHTTPRFVNNMPFPLPIFSSTLLLERGTIITSGVFSRIKPKLGLSLSLQCLSPLSSLSRTLAAPPPRSFCERLHLPRPGKGCTPSPSLQPHAGTLPSYWVSSTLLTRPSYGARRVSPRTSCCRICVSHLTSCGSLETAWNHPPYLSQCSGIHSR